MNQLLSAHETAARLPYAALVAQIGQVLADPWFKCRNAWCRRFRAAAACS